MKSATTTPRLKTLIWYGGSFFTLHILNTTQLWLMNYQD